MVNVNNDCVFVLEFYPKAETSPPIIVWSNDKTDIEIFMKQHAFDPLNVRRYVIPSEDINKHHDILQCDRMLITAEFKSNSSDNIMKVLTSDEILDDIVRVISDDFIDTCTFGDLVSRTDIDFINNITNIIDSIKFASVCDWALIDDNLVDRYYDEDYALGVSQYPQLPPPPADTSGISDELFAERSRGSIQPFTIEAYAHYFISDIMEAN